MSQIWIEAQSSLPWTARCYAMAPVAPIWVGISIALLYLLCVGVFFAVAGGSPVGPTIDGPMFWQESGWWTVVVNAVMIGFAPTVMVCTLRTAGSCVVVWLESLDGRTPCFDSSVCCSLH